jgi:uncharacterized protein YjbI with pentapeptide repeats
MQVIINQAGFDKFYDAGRRDFKRATLQNVDFRGRDISDLDLKGAILTGCNLRNVTIGENQFFLLKPNGVLRGVPCKIVGEVSSIALYEADLTHADVTEMTLLPDARFNETRLTAAQAIRFSDQGAPVEALKGYNCFFGTTMSLAEFDTLIRQGFKNFTGVTVDGIKDEKIPTLTLDTILIVNATIMNVDLSKAVIGQAIFTGTTFSNVRVGREQLEAILRTTKKLGDLDLRRLDLTKMNFELADLTQTKVEGANFNEASLFRAVLGREQLIEILKTNRDLSDIVIASGTSTMLDYIDFTDVNLSQANLDRLDLRKVTLHGAVLNKTSCEYTIMGADQLRCFMKSGRLSYKKIRFHGDLSGISLEGLQFEACSFAETSGVCLSGAYVIGCNLNITDNFSPEQIDGMLLPGRDGNSVELCLSPAKESDGRWRLLYPLDLFKIETVGLNFSNVDLTDAVVMPYQLRDMVLIGSRVPDLSDQSSIILPGNIFDLYEDLRRDPSNLSDELYSIFETVTVIDYCYQTGLARDCYMPDLLDVMRQSKGNFFNPYDFPNAQMLNFHSEFITGFATNDLRQDTREPTILAAAMRQMLFAALISPRLEQESVIIEDAATLNTLFSIVSTDEWAQLNPGLRATLKAKFPEEINGYLQGTAVRPETRAVDADLIARQHAALLTYLSTYFWGTVSGDPEFGRLDPKTKERIGLGESIEQVREAYKDDTTVNLITLALEDAWEDIFIRFEQPSDEKAHEASHQLHNKPLSPEAEAALQRIFDPGEIALVSSTLQSLLRMWIRHRANSNEATH